MDIAVINRQALDLWNNPPDTELSPEAQLDCANRCITQLMLDLDLTPNSGFLLEKSSEFQFDGADDREKDLSGVIQDISRPVRVESRAADSVNDDDWTEERHTSFENWNDTVERLDGQFIAFYGLPPALKMVVARDVSNTVFRVIYQRLTDKITSTSILLDLPSIYEPLLVYDFALEFGELIDNESEAFQAKKARKMVYLLERRKDAASKIDRWRKSQRGVSVTHRRPFNDRQTVIGGNLPRRRFTVNF